MLIDLMIFRVMLMPEAALFTLFLITNVVVLLILLLNLVTICLGLILVLLLIPLVVFVLLLRDAYFIGDRWNEFNEQSVLCRASF